MLNCLSSFLASAFVLFCFVFVLLIILSCFTVVYFRNGKNGPFTEASCNPKRTVTKCEIRNVAYFTRYYVKVDTVLENEFGAESDLESILIPSGSKLSIFCKKVVVTSELLPD